MKPEITFTDQEKETLVRNLKIGILKELHRKKMLTDFQIDQLIRIEANN